MNETFPGIDPESPRKSLRALEEMVELCLASGATPNQIRELVEKCLHKRSSGPGVAWRDESYRDWIGVPAEAADVLIVLFGVAGMRRFDLDAEVDKKMAINRARTWAPRGDGTGYHVKGSEAGGK